MRGGIDPGAIEMMDRLDRAPRAQLHAGYPTDAGATLMVELDGAEAECLVRFDEVTTSASASATGVRIRPRRGRHDLIWRARKAAFAAMGRLAPNYYVQDSVIPRTRLSEVLRRIRRARGRDELRVANVFHAGDGTLHRSCSMTAPRRGARAREELAGLISRACVDAGGSITGEHGVGVDKKRAMPSMFSEPDLATFQRLRCAFDPDGLANPGKVMPTPRPMRRGARALSPAPVEQRGSRSGCRSPRRPDPRTPPPRGGGASCCGAAQTRACASARRAARSLSGRLGGGPSTSSSRPPTSTPRRTDEGDDCGPRRRAPLGADQARSPSR